MGSVAVAPPASAGTCATASGVSVVVDFASLGGGVQTACVTGGGGQRASSLFPAAGFALDYVQSQPGFVCRVSGTPASDPCVNTPPQDAYWGLYWSDGTSGSWTYSNYGVGSLTVPDGGYVGFAWQGSSGRTPPGASPTPHATAASPTASASATRTPTATRTPRPSHTSRPTQAASPTRTATRGPSPSPTARSSASASVTATTTATTSATTSATATARGSASVGGSPTVATPTPTAVSATPSASSSASSSAAHVVTGDPQPTGGGAALPPWLAVLVVVALFGAAGGAAWARRRGRRSAG